MRRLPLWRRLLKPALLVAALAVVFGWVLPQFIDYDEVWQALKQLDAWELAALLALASLFTGGDFFLAARLLGLVAAAAVARRRHAALAQAEPLACLRAGRHAEPPRAVGRRHLDLRAERRLVDRHRHGDVHERPEGAGA